MNKKIKMGMVGGGIGAFIGPIHRIASRLDDQYELVAGVFSNVPEENSESGQLLRIETERCYDHYDAMFRAESSRDDGIDVVVIVTPNHLHFNVAKAALKAGIAVICEKPMTLTYEESLELHHLAQQKGAPFLLTHTYCGYPLVQEAKARIKNGELGEILSFSVEYLQEWLTEEPEESNRQAAWRLDPKLAGAAGCLGDIGTHAFQLASYMIGQPLTQISATLTHSLPGRLVDDNVQATLVLGDSVHGQLWASQTAPGHENALRIRVIGQKASLEWAQEDPNILWVCPYGQPRQRVTRRAEFLTDFAASNTRTPGGHPEGYLEAFGNLYNQFAQQIRNPITNNLWLPSTKTGLDGLQFIEHAIASNKERGAWLPVEPIQ